MKKTEKEEIKSRKEEFEKKAGYALTDNQVLFCIDAEDADFDISFTYSGRGMYGRECPSVRIESIGDLPTTAKTDWDNMGRRFVVYAKN